MGYHRVSSGLLGIISLPKRHNSEPSFKSFLALKGQVTTGGGGIAFCVALSALGASQAVASVTVL